MRPYYLLLVILLPLFSYGQQWKNFTDTAGNFTAKYPPAWVNKIKEGNRVFFTSPSDGESDNFYENVNISVTTKPGYGTDIKVRDLFPTISDGLKEQFTEFNQESLRYFKWNNADAAEVIYSGYVKDDNSLKIRTIQWYCFYRSKLYIVTFVAVADKKKHESTAKKIMNGIIFK